MNGIKNYWQQQRKANVRHMNKDLEKIKVLPYRIMFLFIGLTLLSNCKTQNDAISIRGRAYSFSKSGACIVTRDDKCYYIEDMYKWPDKFEAKKLLVKGKLRIVCDTATLPPDEERQRFIGCQNIIDSATYRVTIFGVIKKELKIDD
jgi:hypothetical protein